MAPRDNNSADLLHPGVGWWTEEEAVFYANPPPLLTTLDEEDENNSTMMDTFSAVPDGDMLDVEEGFDLDDDDYPTEDGDGAIPPLVVEFAEASAGATPSDRNDSSRTSLPNALPSAPEESGLASPQSPIALEGPSINGGAVGRSRTTTAAYEESISYLRSVVYLMWGAPALRSVNHAVGGSRLSSCVVSDLDIAATPATSSWPPSPFVAQSSRDDSMVNLTNNRSGAALVDIGDSLWKCYVEGLLLLHERMMMEKLLRDITTRRTTLRRRHSQISGEEVDNSSPAEETGGDEENSGGHQENSGGHQVDQNCCGVGSPNKRMKRQGNTVMSSDEVCGENTANTITSSSNS